MPAEARIAQYEVVETLAEDATSSTYRVRDGDGDDGLVLKRFLSCPDDPAAEAARLRQGLVADARRRARKAPVGLLAIVDAGELRDGVFVVTAWRPEPTLERLVPLLLRDPESALYVLRSTAAILDRLHGAGSIHRSLKTTNVLVMDDGDVLLTDALHLTSCSGSLLGSEPPLSRALVAAPEQVMGFRQTPASNRYVFAALAYRLLTGSPVFPQGDVVEYLYCTVYRAPRPATEVRSDLPEAFDRLLAWGLDKEPSARPRTCVELVDALSAALAGSSAIAAVGRSAVEDELPWEVAPAPPAPERAAVEVEAGAIPEVEQVAGEDAGELELGQDTHTVEPWAQRDGREAERPPVETDAPASVHRPAAGGLLGPTESAPAKVLRGLWERPRPLGGRAETPTADEVRAADDAPEDVLCGAGSLDEPRFEQAGSEPAEAERHPKGPLAPSASPGGGPPSLRLLKPLAARAPTSAPAMEGSVPIQDGSDGDRSRDAHTRRWLGGRSGWMSRLSASGAPPRDLEQRESYLADWRRGIDPGATVAEVEPMLPTWPLRVEGCAAGARLYADGEPVADVPGAVRLRGRAGTNLQLEVRLDERVLGRRQIRLHPLMESRWDLAGGGGELRTEA